MHVSNSESASQISERKGNQTWTVNSSAKPSNAKQRTPNQIAYKTQTATMNSNVKHSNANQRKPNPSAYEAQREA